MASGHAMQSTPATALSTPATSQSPQAGNVRWKRMASHRLGDAADEEAEPDDERRAPTG